MQEALKEKQQHIEQLLAERDIERTEVAKATSHAGEVQQELALLRKGQEQVLMGINYELKKQVIHDIQIIHAFVQFVDLHICLCSKYALEMEAKLDQLRRLVETADREKVELLNQLEEEKR